MSAVLNEIISYLKSQVPRALDDVFISTKPSLQLICHRNWVFIIMIFTDMIE